MTKKEIAIKILVELSRLMLGVTFLFSGFAKAVDPMGTVYKMDDYFAAFHLSILSFLSLPLSFAQCGLEFIMGAFMLLGIYRKWNSKLILLTMCFMTPFTLYLAISNPVEDCGCFGDALVISNWETFYKNIVLLACAIIVTIYCERIKNFFTGKTYWLAFMYIIVFICVFMGRNYYYDPYIDFRPYTIGSSIPAQMTVEEGKGHIEEQRFIYAKDGVEKEFDESNYPWQDTTWTFVRMDARIIQEGETPVIKDFTINELTFQSNDSDEAEHIDITQEVLHDTNYVFLMISPSLKKMRTSHLIDFEDVANYASDYNYKFYCLTASITSEIKDWKDENAIDFNFCATDERTLKTIIRTNPGLLLLKDGVIVNKWADLKIPSETELNKPINELYFSQIIDQQEENKKKIIYISAIFILPLLALKLIDLYYVFRKHRENETEE